MSQAVHVLRDAIFDAEVVDVDPGPLADKAVRLEVESFSVTSNNVTYAAAGDRMGYWNFFPGRGNRGVVPMWGHALVVESNHPEIGLGERVYGYLPMATHLDVEPGRVSESGFTDMSAHRQPMAVIYNQYTRLTADPEHDPAAEGERMIFGPLFKTGYLIETMFSSEDWFGAEAMVMTSASSKTAMALASVAKDKSPQIKRIGLTSPGNVPFTEDSGLYDTVLTYDQVGQLAAVRSVSVDFAGNAAVLRAIHEQLGDKLAYSCLVGMTHIDGRGGGAGAMPGPEPILFFAPTYAVAAIKQKGAAAFGMAIAHSWRKFLHEMKGSIMIERKHGLAAARDTFTAMAGGKVDPAIGIVIEP